MVYTDAKMWLDAHEIIECKPLKGRWTRKTCLEIAKRGQKPSKKARAQMRVPANRAVPCANCPILAALEK